MFGKIGNTTGTKKGESPAGTAAKKARSPKGTGAEDASPETD